MSINNTILGLIIKQTKLKGDKLTEEEVNRELEKISTPEEARETITYDLDIKAVNGIKEIVDLDDNEVKQILDDIGTKIKIKNEIATKIRDRIRR